VVSRKCLERGLGDVVDGANAGVHVASDKIVEHGSEEDGSSSGHLHFLGNSESVLLKFRLIKGLQKIMIDNNCKLNI